MSRFLLAVQLGSVLCCLSVPVLPAQEHNPQLQDRFIHGVKQSWEKLQHISFRARCTYTGSDSASGKVETREYEIGIRGPNGLQTGVRDGVSFVQARNDAYAFMLHRSAAGTSLQFVERIGVDASIDARIAAIEEQPRAMALAAYYLWTEPLAHVLRRDAFEIERVHALRTEDHEFVRVEFNYAIDDPSQKVHDRFSDGYLVCDPARHWIVNEYGATFLNLNDNATGLLRTVLEHGDAIGEMPVATRISQSMVRRDVNHTSESVITLEVIDRDLREEELYLSHYGLPEPDFGRSWFRTWGWYLIVGIACIAIGVILIRRGQVAR